MLLHLPNICFKRFVLIHFVCWETFIAISFSSSYQLMSKQSTGSARLLTHTGSEKKAIGDTKLLFLISFHSQVSQPTLIKRCGGGLFAACKDVNADFFPMASCSIHLFTMATITTPAREETKGRDLPKRELVLLPLKRWNLLNTTEIYLAFKISLWAFF